jgi:hypothetical protein
MTPTIRDLVAGGDWACAHAEHETLAAVARSLIELVDGEALQLAHEVVGQAYLELRLATRAWSRLATLLRTQTTLSQTA